MTADPLLATLTAIVGPDFVLATAADMQGHLHDWRGRYHGKARAVVRPANAGEVQAIVQACVAARVPMVPQGGNTGLCGAATPDDSGQAVVISLSRLNRVLALDAANLTLTVEAGCTLAAVQAAAEAAGCLFPLSLASEGSCQIGGNVATNAGGVQVLRYGTCRDLVLGMQAILPDGSLWDGLRGLRKDNTGYSLKHLLIGAEGTLGIITALTLKLFPLPKTRQTAWIGLDSPAAAVQLLNRMQATFDARLTAFELVSGPSLALVLKHFGCPDPLAASYPWHVLTELSDCTDTDAPALRLALENLLADALAQAEIGDAVLAETLAQARQLRALRENISDAQKLEGLSIKHDIAVPVSRIPEFLARAGQALTEAFGPLRIVAFGHVGDGNLHYNLSDLPESSPPAAPLLSRQPEINRLIHDLVHALEGSISAEHGIGQLKRDALPRYKSPVELAAMRAIKQALDPLGLMNPGKVLAEAGSLPDMLYSQSLPFDSTITLP